MRHLNRRDFLKRSLIGAASASPLLTMLGSLQHLEAAQSGGEYKAIVCILLEGGADIFNMVLPTQSHHYNNYYSARQEIALPQDTLLPLNHTNANGNNPLDYGMRDNMQQMQQLFQRKELAIIANIGTLVQPTTLEDINNGFPLPTQLFSHNTQRALWMMGNAKDVENKGWAARCGNLFYPIPNPYVNVTVGGNNMMQLGGITEAIAFDDAYISPNTMRYYGFGPESGGSELGNVYQNIYEAHQNSHHKLMAAFTRRRVNKLNQNVALEGLFDNVAQFNGFDNGVHESGRSLGRQLELVAQILSIRNNFPGQRKRQIFFVNHRGWDTHASDNKHQVNYLSDSLGTFQDAITSLGIANNVTTFTISDFGRSLTSNGNGTDHGWGTHGFVMGGAVNGGDIYGTMPALYRDSEDMWGNRMIPTTSMEHYLAAIVQWFGANDGELNTIFPNLHTFGTNHLNFMR